MLSDIAVFDILGSEETRPVHRIFLFQHSETGAEAFTEVGAVVISEVSYTVNYLYYAH